VKFTHTPDVGVVWGSTSNLSAWVRCFYPLKTSRLFSQSWCGTPALSHAFFHVRSITFLKFWSLLILVAVILSAVILLFIALFHLIVISCNVCFFWWMTLSHLRTQIRWLASDIRIWRSLVIPCASVNDRSSSFGWSLLVIVMQPIPGTVPKLMLG
jgi:hypothetical protein